MPANPLEIDRYNRDLSPMKRELRGVLLFMAVLWGLFLLDWLLPSGQQLKEWLALIPRRWHGLHGVLTMHFLHRDLNHILANTFPLIVLLALMAGSRANTWRVVAAVMLIAGTMLWLVGAANTRYIGASVIVFGLIGFLVAAGFFERRFFSIVIAAVVALLYGWSFIWGIIPFTGDRQVSQLAHFLGGLAGIFVAFLTVSHAGNRGGNSPSTTSLPPI